MSKYKNEVVSMMHGYFVSDNIIEFIQRLEELGALEDTFISLKNLVTLAMDNRNVGRKIQ